MSSRLLLADSGTLGGSALASWSTLIVLLVIYVAIVVTLMVLGRSASPSWGVLQPLARIGDSLARLTGVPAWAASSIGTALYGLLIAGEGFYSDVAWHIALGRDDDLFTAPHASILIGLLFFVFAAVVGTLFATMQKVEPALRVGSIRIPHALVPLWALGLGAVSGFPIDDLWHREYGIDVTMWSPPHMLMILGATFLGLAAWLILGGAGVRPTDGAWARGIHVVAGWLTLQGLLAPQGEFSFGVPQFNAVFSPILVALAAGLGLVALRLIHGPGWCLGIVAVSALVSELDLLGGDGGPVETRTGAIFLTSAIAVEVIAWLLGTARTTRFALTSGAAIGTVGLAGEWAHNQGAYQPWQTAMAPEAVTLGTVAAVGAALLGVAVARAVTGDDRILRARRWGLGLAALACVATILIPMRRPTGDVAATIATEPGAVPGTAYITATLDPVDAADDASWFQAMSWQGGGLEIADMEPTGQPGTYRSAAPVPVGPTVDGEHSYWKTLLRLHRKSEMMAVPLYLPADPEIDEPEVVTLDGVARFSSERSYLLRETTDGSWWLSPMVHGTLLAVLALWAASFVVAAGALDPADPASDDTRAGGVASSA